MKGLNHCQFIGALGADPEMKYMPSGSAVANFRIGVSETWKDKQSGEQQERTEWVRLSAFGRLAEIVGEYLRKGSKVYVSGRMQTRKWQAQDGSDRYSTEVVVNDLIMLDGRRQEKPQEQTQETQSQAAALSGGDDFDGDIPFAEFWSP